MALPNAALPFPLLFKDIAHYLGCESKGWKYPPVERDLVGSTPTVAATMGRAAECPKLVKLQRLTNTIPTRDGWL